MTVGSQRQAWLAAGRIDGLSAFACALAWELPRFVASLRQNAVVGIAAG